MKPSALLERELRERVAPRLSRETFNFKSGKLPSFTRVEGDLVHRISFSIAAASQPGTCQFTSAWRVESEAFLEWTSRVRGPSFKSAVVAVSNDWLLPGWPRSSLGFRLLDEPERCEHEMREFVEGCLLSGLPFLRRVTSYEAAAEFCMREGRVHQAAELLAFCGRTEQAQGLLRRAIAEVRARGLSSAKAAALQLQALSEALSLAPDA